MEGEHHYYSAMDLVQMMEQILESMDERECYRPCFYRLFLYVSIERNRLDVLALLSLDERCGDNSSELLCQYLFGDVLDILEKDKLEPLLCEDSSPLTSEGADHLYTMICADLTAASEFAYLNNHLDMFRRLVFQDNVLHEIR